MYLIVTRAFPPEVGGMQSLMWGLAKELSKNFMIKVLQIIMIIMKNLMTKKIIQSRELEELNFKKNKKKPIN